MPHKTPGGVEVYALVKVSCRFRFRVGLVQRDLRVDAAQNAGGFEIRDDSADRVVVPSRRVLLLARVLLCVYIVCMYYMYASMLVCMICMYLCMYVCMYVCGRYVCKSYASFPPDPPVRANRSQPRTNQLQDVGLEEAGAEQQSLCLRFLLFPRHRVLLLLRSLRRRAFPQRQSCRKTSR